jgi:hypothetical protein
MEGQGKRKMRTRIKDKQISKDIEKKEENK